jgi:hypothetical protein
MRMFSERLGGRRKAAGYHRFFGPATYGFHRKGVTASGAPLPS